ncbi:MAG TPA: acetate/propionate family kinase [Smithella sp.]|nr:acetate/propionate family kinase [Smithella sp.]MDM7986048.1 acetate/propionate family kinase [Smithella sp.]HNY50761.1 acetate/propionate family kinase [Smithella sp.]HOG90310.1 acetate/propionate family kinase [Smithella sp.]HOU51794.1 acetate/propionate family kinase [Smithella sp.]
MKVLVINSGSSSLKYELFDLDTEASLMSGAVSRIGLDGAQHHCACGDNESSQNIEAPDHSTALVFILKALTDIEHAPIKKLSEIGAVAHRIGHGGMLYRGPVVIDQNVIDEIRRLIPLMPLHHPAMLTGIEACRKVLPDIPHVAVFDTSFHSKIPEEAAIYGLPHEISGKGIRKFGFHGNSHEYVALKAAEYLETPLRRLNIISCHLGNGASVCAIQRGHSIDTSMGFSPLEGLIMGTRVGDLDPGIIPYLMREQKLSIDELDQMLNNKSGLLGISGVSSDMRELIAAAENNNARALLAIKAFCYRIKKYIGAYHGILGGTDALIFTGGIGENSRGIRVRCIQGLEKIGFAADVVRNERCRVSDASPVCEISARYSNVHILVIATDEELMIARQCARALDYKKSIKHDVLATDKRPIRISVSVRHAHLSTTDVETLFGPGHRLTAKSPLYIDSEFAANETVNLVGPRGRVNNVRIIGPERARTQVEISRTEEFQLGINAPIRESGDLEGSPGIILEGPAGRVELPEGVICAMRHIHMTPEDAENYGVKDKDIVMVSIEGERELIFGDVLVRVKPNYKLEMHIDTDEANAAEMPPVSQGYLVRIESRNR